MKNQKDTIRKMVTYLNDEEENGGFWLPNIQRPFVWSEEQIGRLFDSIMRQYPISTLLIWRTRSEIKHRKFIDNYKHSLRLTDFYVPTNGKAKRLVLDGQQRLQSLFIGLKGSYEGRELYFDVLSGDLVSPEDIRYLFRFLSPDQAVWPWIKLKTIVFSAAPNTKLAKEIIGKSSSEMDDAKQSRIQENIERVRMEFSQDENIAYQELDSIDEPDAYDENDVVEIFIRANSGGTKLGKSDLLFSLLTSSWEEADLAMEELLETLNKTGYQFDRDFVLKTCLTLLDKGARYEVGKFRDGKTKEEIIGSWDKITAAIKDVKDFLYGKTYIRHDKALPSYLALIPVIYFRYHFPSKWPKVQRLDDYLLRNLVAGAFSGSPDNLIDKCVKTIRDDQDFTVSHVFDAIYADGRSLEISPDLLLSLNYGSKELHLFFNLWYKDFNYQPAFQNNEPQVDHIFPQSLLKSVKDVSPETGKRSIMRYKADQRDQIANCMLLTAKENGAGGKSDTPPAEWFEQKIAEEGESYLDLHLIPKDKSLWSLDKFGDFIEARKQLILKKFDYMLLKGGRIDDGNTQAVA
ncbi:MAG: DUF262 domain-containing protein [Gammaproteobacteria bacterium]|nr:DUF262 domain-containing protein [Gammaproteobacteria bacterium]